MENQELPPCQLKNHLLFFPFGVLQGKPKPTQPSRRPMVAASPSVLGFSVHCQNDDMYSVTVIVVTQWEGVLVTICVSFHYDCI